MASSRLQAVVYRGYVADKMERGAVIDIKKEGASLVYDSSSFFSICVVLRHAARHAQRGGDSG